MPLAKGDLSADFLGRFVMLAEAKKFMIWANNKVKRINFPKFMRDNEINPQQIFFTDENNFNTASFLNNNYNTR